MSRSNSVSSSISQTSHKSEPAWFSAYNGVNTTKSRKSSSTSAQTSPVSPGETTGHGLKSFFSPEGRAERKERKRIEQEKLENTVLTSRHTATVKTRMLLEQHNLKKSTTKTGQVQGTINSAHITAAAQEARLPHSGPPALHAHHLDDTRDMPLLSRIISGDEHDEEDEHLQKDRDTWVRKKANVTMRRVAEGDDSGEDQDEVVLGEIIHVDGTRLIGAPLDTAAYTPRPMKPRGGVGAGWAKNESGVWKR